MGRRLDIDISIVSIYSMVVNNNDSKKLMEHQSYQLATKAKKPGRYGVHQVEGSV